MKAICIILFGILSLTFADNFNFFNVADLVDESALYNSDIINTQLIVNGKPTTISKMPWLVWLERGGILRCGGSLLTPTHVVTAAHCTFAYKAADFTINAGTTFLDKPNIIRKVKKITNHPKYKDDDSFDYDIAIMELNEPIEGNTKPIKLAKKLPADNATITIAGWGDLKENATVFNSNELLYIDVFVVNRNRCQEILSEREGVLTDRMFCGWAQGKDACIGDSGSAVIDKNNNLCGIVSWGYGCAYENVPGMNTNVPILSEWIKSVIPSLKV